MSGAAFILGINLLVAGLFCASFAVIALYDRVYVSARWFALCYAFGMAHLAAEATLPLLDNTLLPAFLAYAAFAASLACFAAGIARRYGIAPPVRLLASLLTASFAIGFTTQFLERDSLVRLFLYQAPYCVLLLVSAGIVLRVPNRRPIDNVLIGFVGFGGLHLLTKPVFAIWLGGSGASVQAYLGTTYAMYSQAVGTVLLVAAALLLLSMLVADIFRDVVAKSETDLLSGLLNRRGFEDRLEQVIRRHPVNGLPVSLVICDLDHFKHVNDTYGHGVGDRLIALFATTLRESTAAHHVLGRVGGEEFAVVLPGSNLAAGRLLAESVRAGFAGLGLDDLPDARFTASFGVAEIEAGEPAAAFMARADAALYQAKRAGRDCVRVAPLEQIMGDGRLASSR